MVLNVGRKRMFFPIFLALITVLFSNVANAQEESGLAGVAETIENLFGFIPNIITLEKLIGEDAAAIFWAKFLVWLLLFAAFFFGATKVFKDNKRVAAVVALVFSLIGTLMMPNGWIISIFQSYGFLAGLLIWVVPVAAGFYLVSKIVEGFVVASFWSAFFGALIFSAVSFLLNLFIDPDGRMRMRIYTTRSHYKPADRDVIDIEGRSKDDEA